MGRTGGRRASEVGRALRAHQGRGLRRRRGHLPHLVCRQATAVGGTMAHARAQLCLWLRWQLGGWRAPGGRRCANATASQTTRPAGHREPSTLFPSRRAHAATHCRRADPERFKALLAKHELELICQIHTSGGEINANGAYVYMGSNKLHEHLASFVKLTGEAKALG